jgi:hypothetical protein
VSVGLPAWHQIPKVDEIAVASFAEMYIANCLQPVFSRNLFWQNEDQILKCCTAFTGNNIFTRLHLYINVQIEIAHSFRVMQFTISMFKKISMYFR